MVAEGDAKSIGIDREWLLGDTRKIYDAETNVHAITWNFEIVIITFSKVIAISLLLWLSLEGYGFYFFYLVIFS
ncbi:MAG TPA: hypothetical protein VJ583_05885 [Nitrososphaeraceae archaeon]|jgi:hypothetical protein|nr:hypothetical protein [Nitrososphaeraceae archaeon]